MTSAADPSLANGATRAIAAELDDRRDAYGSLGFHEVERRILAIRGDRFAVSLQLLQSDEGRVTVEVRLVEVDGSGHLLGSEVYDDGELPHVLAELDRRYRASGEATDGAVRTLDALDAMNRRDWDALRDRMDPDLVAVDHQPLGFEPTGREGFVDEWMRGVATLVPDAVTVAAEIRGRGPAVFARIVTVGTTADGNAYEWDSLSVARFGAGGRIEFFPLDRHADARALFEQWATGAPAGAGPNGDGRAGPVGDEAGLAATALWTVLDRHELAVLDRIVLPEVTFEDHVDRGLPSVRTSVQLGKAFRRLFDLAPDTRFVAGAPQTAAAAALLDVEQRSTAPSGTEYRWDRVVVVRCDADGRIDAIECFPADRRAEATARFAEWSGGA